MLDTLISLAKLVLDAVEEAIAEPDQLRADLAKRSTIDTSATDATQAAYQDAPAAALPELADLRARIAALEAKLAAAPAAATPGASGEPAA